MKCWINCIGVLIVVYLYISFKSSAAIIEKHEKILVPKQTPPVMKFKNSLQPVSYKGIVVDCDHVNEIIKTNVDMLISDVFNISILYNNIIGFSFCHLFITNQMHMATRIKSYI